MRIQNNGGAKLTKDDIKVSRRIVYVSHLTSSKRSRT